MKKSNFPPKNTASLWATITSYARLLFHPDTPLPVKGVLALALLYLLSPFDLVPDWIVGLGLVDDLAIVSLLVWGAIRILGQRPHAQSEKK